MKWVKAKKRDVYHLVVNKHYVCNQAFVINTKEARPVPSLKDCCKNCLRYAHKVR